MILTQPEADPVALVQSALEQLISRHDLKGDKVAVSVPGNLGLSKFIKLPPIEAKKIPDIVKYEARQQIPFPLEQVVWVPPLPGRWFIMVLERWLTPPASFC
jgi:type IV pilus assembly protein PilM